jgi:hypothetical protein
VINNAGAPSPPGWYPDERNPGQMLYWDGTAWDLSKTNEASSLSKPFWKRTWFLISVSSFFILYFLVTVTSRGEPSPSPAVGLAAPTVTQTVQLAAVPNLVGLRADEVVGYLTASGLTLGLTTYGDSDVAVDQVISQSPSSSEQVAAGTAISVVLSNGSALQSVAPSPQAPVEDKVAVVPAACTLPTKEVRDGQFGFVVTKLQYGVRSVGDGFLKETAQGRFLIMSLRVENIGNEPRTFTSGNQKVIDSKGREFEASASASLYANTSGQSFLEDINPGNKISVKLVFDLPKSLRVSQAEFADSFFGGTKTCLP